MSQQVLMTPGDSAGAAGSRGAVASSQALATEAAIGVLQAGGTAVDAAVTAMALNAVLEPMSCGLGGDALALIWDPERGALAVNGSGPTSESLSVDDLLGDDNRIVAHLTDRPGLAITVPGALRTWEAMLARYGHLSLAAALEPARQRARHGFPVGAVTARMWAKARDRLAAGDAGPELLLPGGHAPKAGDIMWLPQLADTLDAIAAQGSSQLYSGSIGQALVETVRSMSGVMDPGDLSSFEPEWSAPIEGRYRSVTVHHCPPNSQGVAALVALERMEAASNFEDPLDPERMVMLVDHLWVGLAASHHLVGDPRLGGVGGQAIVEAVSGWSRPPDRFPSMRSGDTAAVVAVDGRGMACCLLSSLYANFGTGIVVPGTGIALHNRASRMSLDRAAVNSLGPAKRPLHTLMPALITEDGRLRGVIGVVGGHRQPQAQVQVITAVEDFGMDPRAAVDLPRVGIDPEKGFVGIEEGVPAAVEIALVDRGHDTRWISQDESGFFGGVQVLTVGEGGLIEGGSDPRKDGSVQVL